MSHPSNGVSSSSAKPAGGGNLPPMRPGVPTAFQPKPTTTEYPPPSSTAASSSYAHAPPSTQTYLPPSAFTPQSFGAGWAGSVLQAYTDGHGTAGDTARMQRAESLASPGWETAQQMAALQVKLERQLGPEYLSSRSGGGGSKFTYIESWKLINLANEVFGFNGWSSSVLALDTDFIDTDAQGRISVGVSARVRVTLRDGVYHEDVGFGGMVNARAKGEALEKAKKEAVTDAVKRCLRHFGNVLGNCIYDKDYEAKVKSVAKPAAKFDSKQLYRRPEFDTFNSRVGIVTDPQLHSPVAPAATYGSAPPSPANSAYSPAPAQRAQGSALARTAMANSAGAAGVKRAVSPEEARSPAPNGGRAPAYRRMPVPAQDTPTRAPPQHQQEQEQEEQEAPASSQPDGVADYDMSGVDLDAASYGVGEGSGGGRSAPPAMRSVPSLRAPLRPAQAQASTSTAFAARALSTTSALPPPSTTTTTTTAANMLDAGRAARAQSVVGGFSFPADKAKENAPTNGGSSSLGTSSEPPPGVDRGKWKRQQSIANMQGAASGASLEGSPSDSSGGSAPKRAKIEYGGHGQQARSYAA